MILKLREASKIKDSRFVCLQNVCSFLVPDWIMIYEKENNKNIDINFMYYPSGILWNVILYRNTDI